MCLGALYWARVRAVYYAGTSEDAAGAGFDDRFIYEQIALAPEDRSIPMRHLRIEDMNEPFERWKASSQRTEY